MNTDTHIYKGNFPWMKTFPEAERPAAIEQWQHAQARFYDQVGTRKEHNITTFGIIKGYQSRIRELAGKYGNRRCFILGNGPSLQHMDLSRLKDEITIGSNGIYRLFEQWGFHTTFFTMEDVAQIEDRRHELTDVKGPIRIFGLDNSYCVSERDDTLFANVIRYSHPFEKKWWKSYYPGFSIDFSSAVYLGSTVTYLNLQLAFYLGCNPVYIIGVDHDYGPLPKLFPPGKIEITEEVLALLESLHCVKGYHKLGGKIGVPYVKEQEQAFRKAKEVYTAWGRELYNAGLQSKLDILPKATFADIF